MFLLLRVFANIYNPILYYLNQILPLWLKQLSCMFLLVFKLCFPYFERSFQFSVFEQSLPLALPHRFWSEDEFGETSQHNLPLAKNLQDLSCLRLPHPAANSSFLLYPFLVALKFGPNQWMYRVAGAVRFLTTLLWQL